MKRIILAVIATHSTIALANQHVNASFNQLKSDAELCRHFSGEWDTDLPKERKDEIQAGLNQYCNRAKDTYQKLNSKKANPKQLSRILKEYDFLNEAP